MGVVHTHAGESLPVPLISPYINEFDFQTDFDETNLHILPGHYGMHRVLKDLNDLDVHVCMDAQSYANARAAWEKLYNRYKDCKAGK